MYNKTVYLVLKAAADATDTLAIGTLAFQPLAPDTLATKTLAKGTLAFQTLAPETLAN